MGTVNQVSGTTRPMLPPPSPQILGCSTPKPPSVRRKPERFHDQLSFLDDLLERKEDASIHEKLDIIIENQKVLFKFMADVMAGGSVDTKGRTNVRRVLNLGLGHVSNMEGASSVSVERDRTSSVFEGRDGERSNLHYDLSQDLGHMSYIQGASSVSVGRDGPSTVFEGRDGERSNFVSGDISGGSLGDPLCFSIGAGKMIEWGTGPTQQGSSGRISNAMGRSGSSGEGSTGSIASRGNRGNQHGILRDISNVMGRPNASEEGYREVGHVSREQSLGEEGEKFMGEALVLKRSSL